MKVLIGCEESGVMRRAFRERGHDAWSNDIQPARDGSPYHYQMCVMDAIDQQDWDLIILHPDCTALAVSGNRWYGKGMPLHRNRIDAIDWTVRLWNKAALKAKYGVCLENPVSVVFKYLDGADVQYIHPWQHGHGETKKTGLALIGLPRIVPTNIVDGREQRIWKMPPSETRKRDRSETFQGVADAIADQWGAIDKCCMSDDCYCAIREARL